MTREIREMLMKNIKIEQIDYRLTWPVRHEVMYPNQPFDMIKLENDDKGVHFGLFADHQLTSVVSLFFDGQVYQFRKFATLAAVQGSGYGSSLLRYVISYTAEKGGAQLWCNARLSVLGFYERFGFVRSGEVYTKNDIDFVKMELNEII